MNDKKTEALKLALEALEHEAKIGNDNAYFVERQAIKEALADQPAQQKEPVAWRSWSDYHGYGFWETKQEAELWCADDFFAEPLYTSPPRKTLTDEELSHIHEEYHDCYGQPINSAENGWAYERAIIRAACCIKEKNT